MLKHILFVCAAALAGLLCAQPALDWQRTLGGSGSEQATCVSVHSDGGVFLVGTTSSNDIDVSGALGETDIWVTRLDATGALIWQRCIGGSGSDMGKDVIATNDGGCVVLGETESIDGMVSTNMGSQDIWMVKLSSSGDLEWEISLGGSGNDLARKCQLMQNGDLFVTGQSNSPEVPGNHAPGSDLYLARVSSAGEFIMHRSFGGSESEAATGITITPDDIIVLCGSTRSNDGDVVGNQQGALSIWVLAVNAEFDVQWQRLLFSTNGWSQAQAVCAAPNGLIVVTGETNATEGDIVSPPPF